MAVSKKGAPKAQGKTKTTRKARTPRAKKENKANEPGPRRIFVVVRNPGEPSRVEQIEPTLDEFQRLVGGYIESAILFFGKNGPIPEGGDHLALRGYVNEEAGLRGLPINALQFVPDGHVTRVCAELRGPIVLFGHLNDDGEETGFACDVGAKVACTLLDALADASDRLLREVQAVEDSLPKGR